MLQRNGYYTPQADEYRARALAVELVAQLLWLLPAAHANGAVECQGLLGISVRPLHFTARTDIRCTCAICLRAATHEVVQIDRR
jgi:hypothetical protein